MLAATHNPADNIHRLEIRVANFDGGSVGAALATALTTIAANPGSNGFTIVDASATSPQQLRDDVKNGNAWGAVWINAGATAALNAAVADPAGVGATYDAKSAITFAWDEGRNAMITTARIGGPIKGILSGFVSTFATNFVRGIQINMGNAVLGNVAVTKPSLLVKPIDFTEESLFPAFQLPVMATALTIGNILMAVFSMAITIAVSSCCQCLAATLISLLSVQNLAAYDDEPSRMPRRLCSGPGAHRRGTYRKQAAHMA